MINSEPASLCCADMLLTYSLLFFGQSLKVGNDGARAMVRGTRCMLLISPDGGKSISFCFSFARAASTTNKYRPPAMGDTWVYKDPQSHPCIDAMSKLFEGLEPGETVEACINTDPGADGYQTMTEVHNHLSSCKTWAAVHGWDDEVEYTINHPLGDVYAYDTKSTGTRLRTIDYKQPSFEATCEGKSACVLIRRVSERPVNDVDITTKRFSWVKVMNVKRFFYESARSSFVYKLVVLWQGATKEEAKQQGPDFKLLLETRDHAKMTAFPAQGLVSFMEKTLDVVSDGSRRALRVTPGT